MKTIQWKREFLWIYGLFKVNDNDDDKTTLALWNNLKPGFKLGSSKLTADVFVEVMDRYEELDVFVRDCEALDNVRNQFKREYLIMTFTFQIPYWFPIIYAL